ncbi:hypothetical protein P8452_12348 [Trifolium repens]|nr:hypothetical protein P8452_12348 [Trifolium repens]
MCYVMNYFFLDIAGQKSNNKRIITAADAQSLGDIQGISWVDIDIMTDVNRTKFRNRRLRKYENVEDQPSITPRHGTYYNFWQYTKFQEHNMPLELQNSRLNHLIWSTSKHDVYLPSEYSVHHWSGITFSKSNVVDLKTLVEPTENHPGSLAHIGGFNQTKVRAIGSIYFTASFKSNMLKLFEAQTFQLLNTFQLGWPIQHTSMSPEGGSILVVGAHRDGALLDTLTGQHIASLPGHLDSSLSCAWHPNGIYFATGNQDRTCRIWDIRNMGNNLHLLKGNMGGICSINFTSDGELMAMAESADFVHIFDTKQHYENAQVIDFFGEVSGLSFSPDTQSLFIGVEPEQDMIGSTLLWYDKCRNLERYNYV